MRGLNHTTVTTTIRKLPRGQFEEFVTDEGTILVARMNDGALTAKLQGPKRRAATMREFKEHEAMDVATYVCSNLNA